MMVMLGRIADRWPRRWVLVPWFAEHQDFAPCRLQQIESDLEKRGFATAIGSYQTEHATGRDGEVDFPQDKLPPTSHPHILKCQCRRFAHSRAYSNSFTSSATL